MTHSICLRSELGNWVRHIGINPHKMNRLSLYTVRPRRTCTDKSDHRGHTATVPKLLAIPKLIDAYFRRRIRLAFLLKAKIKPRNRARRVSTITAQLKGGFMHIGSKGSIRDRPLPMYHTASLALPTSSCPYVIVSTWHRTHLVSGDITA
jgi:hypothetical protein